MIEKGLILTGDDAKLLSQTLKEVKTKAYAESENGLVTVKLLMSLFQVTELRRKEERKKKLFAQILAP